jgi:hypothetical protein
VIVHAFFVHELFGEGKGAPLDARKKILKNHRQNCHLSVYTHCEETIGYDFGRKLRVFYCAPDIAGYNAVL